MLNVESEDPGKDDESLEEIERSDWKQKPEDKKQTSDGKVFNSEIGYSLDDADPIRKDRPRYDHFKKNTCRNNLSESKISSNKNEFDKLSVPVKRKIQSDSAYSIDDSDYPLVPTKM